MATFRLNIARIRGCPPPAQLDEALAEFGLPEDQEFGVLNHSATDKTVFATIIRRTRQTIQRLDTDAGEVTADAVERVDAYPCAVRPAAEILEVYSSPATAAEKIGAFFSSCLALPTTVEAIELDIPSALDMLAAKTQRFQLRALRVSDYAHNSFMSGPYAPKFLDTQHGKDFLDEYAEHVRSADVRFQGHVGRVNVKLTPKACFGYSCDEEDQTATQVLLRQLV